ncbi:RNA polymerase sigma factor [Lacinutrix cladophorae]
MTTNQDQIIIQRILEGETKAFAVLVDRYKDLVFTLAMQMVKNREEAEEVSQDTFIKVFKKLQHFKGDSKFSTWIYRITYNTCLDRIKSNKWKQNTVAINEFTEQEVKTLDNALSNLEATERKQAIHDCLQMLPANDCALLTLYYFEELSLEEIAKVIGVKANNVKVKLFRSRKKLTTILQNKLEPEIIEGYERARK